MNTVPTTDTYLPTRFPEGLRYARMHLEFENGQRKMTPDEFWDFCKDNHKLRAELTKEGDVIIMPPTGYETGDLNSEINYQLRGWTKLNRTGTVTDSSTGFTLPNGAVYSPDAAWTLNSRLDEFSEEERQKFLPLCPDFVLELRSPSNTLTEQQAKLEEFIENGARLGWLIDPYKKNVNIYRPDTETEILQNPSKVSGEDILPGFELDLIEIW